MHLVKVGVVITVGVILVMAMAMAGDTAMVGAGDILVMVIIHLIILDTIHHIILGIMKEQLMENVMLIIQVEWIQAESIDLTPLIAEVIDLAEGMSLQTILAETDEIQVIPIQGTAEVVQEIAILLIQKGQVIAIPIADLDIEIDLDLTIVEVITALQPHLADHTRQVQEEVHLDSEVVLQAREAVLEEDKCLITM